MYSYNICCCIQMLDCLQNLLVSIWFVWSTMLILKKDFRIVMINFQWKCNSPAPLTNMQIKIM